MAAVMAHYATASPHRPSNGIASSGMSRINPTGITGIISRPAKPTSSMAVWTGSFRRPRMSWRSSVCRRAMGTAGRQVDDPANPLPLTEPREQDSRALYLQLAYHKVESAQREWRVQAYHSRNRFDADTLSDLTHINACLWRCERESIPVADAQQYRAAGE